MRILVLSTWFPSTERPTQAPFNLKHAEAIALHHDVRVIHVRLGCALPPRHEQYAGQPVLRLSFTLRRPWRVFGILRQIRRALADADLLHTMAFSAALFGRLAIIGARKPWVHTEHWNGVLSPTSVSSLWVSLAWVRRILRRPDWLTGVTTQLAATLASFGRPSSTSVVPCVVQNPLALVRGPAVAQLRLIAIGGLIDRKRPLLAVHTVQWLVEQGHDVAMVWLGDGPLRDVVADECARLGIRDRFALPGAVDPDAVFGHLEGADVFFLPSSQENFFTAAAEALSAGRPVVAARVGGFSDYTDERNSVLVDDPTPENFGRAVLRARELCTTVPVLEIAGRVREQFSLATVGAQFDEVYGAVMHHRSHG